MGSQSDQHHQRLNQVLDVRCQAAQNRLRSLLREHQQRSTALAEVVAQRKAIESAGNTARAKLYRDRPAAWQLLERYTQSLALQQLTSQTRDTEQNLGGDLQLLEQHRRDLARRITALQHKLTHLRAISARTQRRRHHRLDNC